MPRDRWAAADPQAAKKKKQLIIIALLLVGLLISVVTQPSKDREDEYDKTAELVSLKTVDSKSPEDAAAPREEITSVRELSRLEIDRVLHSSLFYVPEPEHEPEQEMVQEEVAPEVRVQAIYGDGKLTENSESTNHRVLVGRAIIRSGEVLPDGRQIVRVTPDGVELAQ